jgi:hypothetical protein
MRLTTLPLCAAAIATVFCGCAARNLVFTTYTKVGLDVSATSNEPPNGVFGYKRFEGTIIPFDAESAVDEKEDVASVYSAIDLKNEWFGGLAIFQVFATGTAAQKVAEKPEGMAKFIAEARESRGKRAENEGASE